MGLKCRKSAKCRSSKLPGLNSRKVKMWATILLLVAILCCHYTFVSGEETPGGVNLDTLKLVQIVFRHGDRNPLASYPTDPYQNETKYWPEGFGQLTTLGKSQLFKLGQFLRQRYNGFISPTYNPKETFIWSSYSERCIMSALAAAAGLYPPKVASASDDTWNSFGNFQLVPVQSIPKEQDRFLETDRKSCPKVNVLLKDLLQNSEQVQGMNKKYTEFFKKLSVDTGKNVQFVTPWLYYLHDTLFVEEQKGLSLPAWAQPLMKEESPLMEIKRYAYTVFTKTKELKQLYSGELVKELLKNMKNGTHKLVMFSGHDMTITNLMNTLGIYDSPIKPVYASSLIIEYHKPPESADGFVKVLFRNSSDHEPYEFAIPECGSSCGLAKLEQLMEPYMSSNWELDCKIGSNEMSGVPEHSTNSSSTFSYTSVMSKMLSIAVAVWAWI